HPRPRRAPARHAGTGDRGPGLRALPWRRLVVALGPRCLAGYREPPVIGCRRVARMAGRVGGGRLPVGGREPDRRTETAGPTAVLSAVQSRGRALRGADGVAGADRTTLVEPAPDQAAHRGVGRGRELRAAAPADL